MLLSVGVRASSFPDSDHAYAEYLTISPKPSSYCSISPHDSDDGYTSLNNMEKPHLSNEDDHVLKQHAKKNTRRRVRVLAHSRCSSSCRWSSTSEGGGTVVSRGTRRRSRSGVNTSKDVALTQGIVDGMYRLKLRRSTDSHYPDVGNKNLVRKYRMKSRHNTNPEGNSVSYIRQRKYRHGNRSSSCHCHRSNTISTPIENTPADPISEVVYDSVKSDAETDLQPLLPSSSDVASRKKTAYSSTYYSAKKDLLQYPSSTSRPSNRVRKQRSSTTRYDSCTLVTMLVV